MLLRQHAELTDADFDAQMDRKAWPALKEKLDQSVQEQEPRGLVRDHGRHRHLLRADPTWRKRRLIRTTVARKIFVERHGVTQPAPAPRFSRTPSAIREPETVDIACFASAWQSGKYFAFITVVPAAGFFFFF